MMKITNSLLLLAAFGVHSVNAIDLCISETTGALTKCVLETCAPEADKCTYTTTEDDTCAQFDSSCTELMDKCCSGNCKTATAKLLDCATGQICAPFTCGAAPATRALQAVEPSPPFSRKLATELGGAVCVSEATAAYTKCLINSCPGADKTCTFTATDGDTCQDVADFCPTVNACCPACETSLEALLDCSTGDLCGAFDCVAGTVAASVEPESDPEESGGMTPDVMAALGGSLAMMFLA